MKKKRNRKINEKSIKTLNKINETAKVLYKNKKGKRVTRSYNYNDALIEAGKKIKSNKLF